MKPTQFIKTSRFLGSLALSALVGVTASACGGGEDSPADAAPIRDAGSIDALAVTDAQSTAPAVLVDPQAGTQTTEAGGTTTFSIVLASAPNSAVSIDLASNDPGEGVADLDNVTFGLDNWDQPVTVTVTGVDDVDEDGDVIYSIVTEPTVSADPNYDGLVVPDAVITNVDNDPAV